MSRNHIQRNGELYEFLTDEEKDVEQEIKNTEVDSKDVSEELAKILFDQIIRTGRSVTMITGTITHSAASDDPAVWT